MRRRYSPTLVDLVRSTVAGMERKVEQDRNRTDALQPDEQTLRHLESSVLRTMAEMQLRRSERRDSRARIHLVENREAGHSRSATSEQASNAPGDEHSKAS